MAKKEVAEQQSLGEAMNKTELFLENNGRKISYALLAVLLLGGAIYAYRALVVAPRAEKAAEKMVVAQGRFEAQNPDYELALNGDDTGAGFLEVIEQYGSTPAGSLAKHYAGACYLHLGNYDEAAKYLAQYSSVKGLPGSIVNAQNLGMQGDVAVEQGNYAKAVKLFEKAAKASDNTLTAPLYLLKGGRAATAAGDNAKAAALYEKILAAYPASMEAREAQKLVGGAK